MYSLVKIVSCPGIRVVTCICKTTTDSIKHINVNVPSWRPGPEHSGQRCFLQLAMEAIYFEESLRK